MTNEQEIRAAAALVVLGRQALAHRYSRSTGLSEAYLDADMSAQLRAVEAYIRDGMSGKAPAYLTTESIRTAQASASSVALYEPNVRFSENGAYHEAYEASGSRSVWIAKCGEQGHPVHGDADVQPPSCPTCYPHRPKVETSR
jgi:hypothetical protein